MAKKRLSEKDLDQLLSHYRAERRRLMFQLELVRSTILDLKKVKGSQSVQVAKAADPATGIVKRGPGRPRKVEGAVRAPVASKKRERKERELNAWDTQVIDAIRSSGRLMPKEELLKHVSEWAATHQPSLTATEVETFLTRTLQKLSGKKKLLGTHHTGLRRGYHYGLKDWFFQSSGKLRKQHFDRLVLSPSPEIVEEVS